MQADRGEIACAATAHWRPIFRPVALISRPTQWPDSACDAWVLNLSVVTVRTRRPTPYQVHLAERTSVLVHRPVLPRACMQRLAHLDSTRALFAHEEPASFITSSQACSPC